MAGVFSGIMGSLMGAGIQAALGNHGSNSETKTRGSDLLRAGGLPISFASITEPKMTEAEKTKQIYDNIEAHLNGALQVLGPCIEIVNALNTPPVESKSKQHGSNDAYEFRQEWIDNLRKSLRLERADGSADESTSRNAQETLIPDESSQLEKITESEVSQMQSYGATKGSFKAMRRL